MDTYLFTWAPYHYPVLRDEYRQWLAGRWHGTDWSSGNNKSIPRGARVFFMRQGEEPRGIFGSGYTTSGWKQRPAFDGTPGKVENCNDVAFDVFADPDDPLLLMPQLLDIEPNARRLWSIMSSGVHIDGDVAKRLEAAWAMAIARRGLTVRKVEGGTAASLFQPGRQYTRKDVYEILAVPEELQGGNWDTGYNRYQDTFYIFCGVGTGGRTGHDYGNRWIGDTLHWKGKTNSRIAHPEIQRLTSGNVPVLVFTREADRAPFTFQGPATAQEVQDTVPVTVIWRFGRTAMFPEEVPRAETYYEGATKTVSVNVYERDERARAACIAHYGAICAVCRFNFGQRYGPLGEGFIHVHHLKPLAEIGEGYQVDPVRDLRPVCPNCHAMIHRQQNPCLTIEQLQAMLQN